MQGIFVYPQNNPRTNFGEATALVAGHMIMTHGLPGLVQHHFAQTSLILESWKELRTMLATGKAY